ncbi:hypothetical protein RB4940 [Rhodopirellula baltica SH 1]|uniref:Uncharacterized protein n=1 Tax=Rhodopirellula baltica (strain DSM 10527 / NCIMB 13988 / SH1) TaxID=243090 RepID=Q7UGY8_RHOBA|nr:hypothetical protein RB4940 [Rhodopirellula baltica SH 1]
MSPCSLFPALLLLHKPKLACSVASRRTAAANLPQFAAKHQNLFAASQLQHQFAANQHLHQSFAANQLQLQHLAANLLQLQFAANQHLFAAQNQLQFAATHVQSQSVACLQRSRLVSQPKSAAQILAATESTEFVRFRSELETAFYRHKSECCSRTVLVFLCALGSQLLTWGQDSTQGIRTRSSPLLLQPSVCKIVECTSTDHAIGLPPLSSLFNSTNCHDGISQYSRSRRRPTES